MTKPGILSSIFLLTAVAASTAMALSPGMGSEGRFSVLDRDQDGAVSFPEFKQAATANEPGKLFHQLDLNGDGLLSKTEFNLWESENSTDSGS
ncbi:MAG: EF-hand domain-containing protein [Thiotrichales bacterium]